MSTFLNRLTPETLSAIITDLTWQRFLSRDEACAALDTCKTCAFYAEALQDPDLVVVPSEDTKPGWILAEASVLARRKAEEEAQCSTDSQTQASGSEVQSSSGDMGEESGSSLPDDYIGSKEESQAPDSADRDSGDLTRPYIHEDYDPDPDPESGAD